LLLPWHLMAAAEKCAVKWVKSGIWKIGFCKMIMHLFTRLCEWVNFPIITKWLLFHTPPPPLARLSSVWLLSFPKLKMVLNRRKFNDNTLIHAKCGTHLPSFKQHSSWNAFSGRAITELTMWSPKVSSLKRTTLIRKRCCYGEINSVQKLFYCTTYMKVGISKSQHTGPTTLCAPWPTCRRM
jgi:hypothetical protein